MPNVNPGPASTGTPNAQPPLIAPQGSRATVTVANLPSTGLQPGETAYTTDQGLVYWTGTAWVALASTTGGTPVALATLAAGTFVGQVATTTDAGVVFWNGTAWLALDGAKDSQRVLAIGKALNVNQTGDVGLLSVINSTRWNVQAVVAGNLSAGAGTSVAIAVCSATAGAAVTIVAPVILSSLVAFGGASVAYRPVVQNVSFVGTGSTIFINCQTTAGTACTLDVFIYGYDMS